MKKIINEIKKFENIEVDEYYEIVIIRDFDYDKLFKLGRLCETKGLGVDIDTMYQELKLFIFF